MDRMLGLWLAQVAMAAPEVDAWLDALVLVRQGGTACAGTVVSPQGVVATAYHCVAAGGRPGITTRDGASVVGRVIAVDRARDLALLDAPALAGASWRPLAEAPPPVGAAVWALGHPGGSDAQGGFWEGTLRWSVSAGVVSAVGVRALQFDAAVSPGSSGGPLLDTSGSVVGVVSRRLRGEGLGFAGRGDALAALLVAQGPGPGALGGTVAGELLFGMHGLSSAALGLGGRVEAALRDRVVVSASGMAPLSHRWGAARFGRSDAVLGDGRLGVRQRLGRGAWTGRVDAWGGVAWVHRLEARDPDDPLRLVGTSGAAPLAGGTVRVRSVGFELGALWQDGAPIAWTAVMLRWPGVVGVF